MSAPDEPTEPQPEGEAPTGDPRTGEAPANAVPAEQDLTGAERVRRADRATRGVLAGTLGLEALVVLLVPRALAASSSGLGTTKTLLLVGLAVVMIIGAGMVRRPWGVALGSALQIPLMLTGIWIGTMFVLAALFWAVWYRVLVLRRDVVGTARGLRMLVS